jgi:peptidoglycan/LPS O-acetylase OafA/YrhL
LKEKHRALLMLVIVSFVLPMGEVVIYKQPAPEFSGYVIAEVLLPTYAIYWWYVLDRRERNFRAGALQNTGVAAFGLIGFPIYLIRSRGWLRGTGAIAVSLGILICTVALTYFGTSVGRTIASHAQRTQSHGQPVTSRVPSTGAYA